MSWGFVYVLWNESMPGVYKVGRTSRSPSARAEELSRSTGVPTSFSVVCYAESEKHELLESEIHKSISHLRVNDSREFFQIECLRDLMASMILQSESFCLKSVEAMLVSGEIESSGEFCLDDFIYQVRKSACDAKNILREVSK